MKRILFYYPSNKASVQIETTLFNLKELGHTIFLLTSCEKGILHQRLEEKGIETHANPIPKNYFYYPKQILFLIKFCSKKKIDYVFGNLQHANFIAVIAQYFLKAKVITFRHHFKFNKGNFGIPLKVNKNEVLFDKIINRLSKCIVVPSKGVYQGIVQFEKVYLKKLHIIPYLYDFELYPRPNGIEVESIRKAYKARMLVIMAARLIPFKRHLLLFPVFKKLIERGFDIQVLILDEGPEKDNLDAFIKQNQLENHIHLLGYRKNIIDFLAASDVIIHPSLTEASSNVIKEIGLQEKVVMVCKGVGDFDAYIEHGSNGFFLDIAKPEVDAEKYLSYLYENPNIAEDMGKKLKESILNNFASNKKVLQLYEDILKKA